MAKKTKEELEAMTLDGLQAEVGTLGAAAVPHIRALAALDEQLHAAETEAGSVKHGGKRLTLHGVKFMNADSPGALRNAIHVCGELVRRGHVGKE